MDTAPVRKASKSQAGTAATPAGGAAGNGDRRASAAPSAIRKKKGNDEASVDGEAPATSFQSFVAEGDILAKQGDFKKAVEAFTKALALRPTDKNGLVARSKCFLQLGDSQASLEDANSALKEDPEFFKGIFQKAEALYAKGDFEMSLVFYHRGNRLRPELDEFRLGIQKAREAINNSIGNPKDYRFQAPSGVKFLQQPGGEGGTHSSSPAAVVSASARPAGAPPSSASSSGRNGGPTTKAIAPADSKQLLGELYADKEYLEKLLADKDFVTNPNNDISAIVSGALGYLDARTEFWRQQKPIYARRKEHRRVLAKAASARCRRATCDSATVTARPRTAPPAVGGPHRPFGSLGADGANFPQDRRGKSETEKSVIAALNVIANEMASGDLDSARLKAQNLLVRVCDMTGLYNRERYVSDVTSTLGRIHMELGCLPQAVQYYRKDLAGARAAKLDACTQRALGNLGRACVRLRRYEEAIAVFTERLQVVDASAPSPTAAATAAVSSTSSAAHALDGSAAARERAWLLHDIGRCNLELGRFARAREMAEAAAAAATSAAYEPAIKAISKAMQSVSAAVPTDTAEAASPLSKPKSSLNPHNSVVASEITTAARGRGSVRGNLSKEGSDRQ
ncbi:Tetratricopeptide repeat protein 25 [Cladochytrium tenue]|nr:Tetratricopeptide repeat protein 25 [Cladochytrium tenue]